jgi:photosystem II stability/assembly factor-like uncharacterized protein
MTITGTVWAPIGPSPISEGSTQDNGLVTTIAVNPNNQNVVYVGTAQGGVWRSTDGGDHWTPIFDRQQSLGIGEPGGIAIDPNDTTVIYVGTSSRVGSAEPNTVGQPPAGLFKSTDGGSSWIALGSGYPAGNTGNASQFVSRTINVIRVDPADSQTIYMATSAGVFVSQDGGQNWTRATGLSGDTRSLELDLTSPPNARVLYAGVDGAGAFRSTNGASSFTQILSSSTPVLATALGTNGFTQVAVRLAPPTAPPDLNGVQVIYVAVAGTYNGPDPIGFFISTDHGSTWTQLAASGVSGGSYGGYAFALAVDPASPGDGINDTLYFGSIRQWASTDAGASFNSINAGHADTHAWALVPQTAPTPSIIWAGTDGGIDVSVDGGSSFTPKNGGGLQTGLFYNIAVKPDATASVTAGALQDNAIQTNAGESPPEWQATIGGDGWDVTYDGSTPPVLYSTSGGPNSQVNASTDDGQTWGGAITPPWGATDTGGFLLTQITADPSAAGTLYVSGEVNLWQQPSGGAWRIILSPGTSGNVNVAPANGNHVVMAAGSKVLVSTNALAATVGPGGVTFTDITANLPSRNVSRVAFDPVDPNILYAVMNGFSGGAPAGVFRTTIGASSWTNISPAVDVPCGAIALDGTTTPTTLYVGTDLGVIRSTDEGASWSVLDDLRFPRVAVFDLGFNPQAGVLRAGTYGRGVWEFAPPSGPAIAVELQDGLAFGTACAGPHYMTLTLDNVGVADLVISNVERLMGSTDFTVLSTPATPLVIAPGASVDFTVVFAPTNPGGAPETATVRITSNDPAAPTVDVTATGTPGAPALVTAIADGGNFGNVCLGSFADEPLVLNNAGSCPLSVTQIDGAGEFLAPSVITYPLVIAPGDAIAIPIRFQPTHYGGQADTIRVISDDPNSPATVAVSGNAPAPRATLILADRGEFGPVCVGAFRDEPLVITNSGGCLLTITAITSDSPEFIVPEVLAYPITIGAGDALPVPIRLQPTSTGSQDATITVTSDDPASPATIHVSGEAPTGQLAVSGSTFFGGVSAHCYADRTVTITNIGECALHVTSVDVRRPSRYWRILHNPFPATLRPGVSLAVTVQYHATERCARITELEIHSDDPTTPDKSLELVAYSLWDEHHCGEKHCGHDDGCRCGCEHRPRCRQGYPGCCEDDDQD